jgi:hypothetical protein
LVAFIDGKKTLTIIKMIILIPSYLKESCSGRGLPWIWSGLGDPRPYGAWVVGLYQPCFFLNCYW